MAYEEYNNTPHLEKKLANKTSAYAKDNFLYIPKGTFVDGDGDLTFTVSGLPVEVIQSLGVLPTNTVPYIVKGGYFDDWQCYICWDTKTLGVFNVTVTATSSDGKSVSDNFYWNVQATKPTVETGELVSVTHDSAIISGLVLNSGGSAIELSGMKISSDDPVNTEYLFKGDENGNYNFNNLASSIKYSYQFFSKNSLGYTFGEIKSFTTDFRLDVSKVNDLSAFKDQLILAGVSNILDINLELYQDQVLKYLDYIVNDSDLLHSIVGSVNSEKSFIIIPLELGWNLVSSPFDNINLVQMLSDKGLNPTVFEFANQRYQLLGAGSLKVGKGYWVFVDESCAVLLNSSTPATLLTTTLLEKGWNLVGLQRPMSIKAFCMKNQGVNKRSWSWDKNKDVYIISELMKLGQGYWLSTKSEGPVELF